MNNYTRDAIIELDFNTLGKMITQQAIEEGFLTFRENFIINSIELPKGEKNTIILDCDVFEELTN